MRVTVTLVSPRARSPEGIVAVEQARPRAYDDHPGVIVRDAQHAAMSQPPWRRDAQAVDRCGPRSVGTALVMEVPKKQELSVSSWRIPTWRLCLAHKTLMNN